MATTTATMAATETMTTTTLSTASEEPSSSSSTQQTRGLFRYIPRNSIPEPNPHLYHLPPMSAFGDERLLPLRDIRPSISLEDSSPYRLDTYGFTARRYPSKMHSAPYTRDSWNDAKNLKQVYFPEVMEMVQKITGCKTVVVESAVLRSELWTEVDGLARSEDKPSPSSPPSEDVATEKTEEAEDDDDDHDSNFPKLIGVSASGSGGASPAPKVHLDYAPAGARLHIRKYHPKLASAAKEVIAAEDRLLSTPGSNLQKEYDGPRWALFSIWRPLKPVTRDPLALSDCRAFPMEDYVEIDVVFPELTASSTTTTGSGSSEGEQQEEGKLKTYTQSSYLAHFSPSSPSSSSRTNDKPGKEEEEDLDRHKWHYISAMQPEEVYVIQLFDSEMEKRGLGVAGGVMHSSVVLEGTDDSNEPPRESLETRVACFW